MASFITKRHPCEKRKMLFKRWLLSSLGREKPNISSLTGAASTLSNSVKQSGRRLACSAVNRIIIWAVTWSGLSNLSKEGHQAMWLDQGNATAEADRSLHDLFAKSFRLLCFLQAARGLFVVPCPDAQAGGRQACKSSDFIEVAKLLCFVMQAR